MLQLASPAFFYVSIVRKASAAKKQQEKNTPRSQRRSS